MINNSTLKSRIEALNQPAVQINDDDVLKIGWNAMTEYICHWITDHKRDTALMVTIDGYVNTDWQTLAAHLTNAFVQHQITSQFYYAETCLKTALELQTQFEPYLGDDPVFGRLYNKTLKSFFDPIKLKALKTAILKQQRQAEPAIILCCGVGASLILPRYKIDLLCYIDLTREEVLKRNKSWTNTAGKTQSISPKKLYYIDFPVNDRHRNQLQPRLDFYMDGNDIESPLMISQSLLQKATTSLAGSPFCLKYLYEPGPWGGQWLKKIRRLPAHWINCAWSYEVIAPEQSILLQLDHNVIIEFPWTTFFALQYDKIMGNIPRRRFAGQFPIRYDYLDTMDGGDLSIQVHPTTSYIRKQFGEAYHQGEMYYLVAARDGACVNLGINQETKRDDFFHAATLADEQGIAFDYRQFVNSVPCKKHDLLLIPPGTVHGSGVGNVVLEISATTYRYTFKIYDHLRPDLSGVMRPIHVRHAFNVIKWFRRTKWVDKNLRQEPMLVRQGNGWAEYLIGDRREFFHIVFRLEFDERIDDDTSGKFHILTLVEGDAVLLHAIDDPSKRIKFNYSETIIVPACFGKYTIINQGVSPCTIVKAGLR